MCIKLESSESIDSFDNESEKKEKDSDQFEEEKDDDIRLYADVLLFPFLQSINKLRLRKAILPIQYLKIPTPPPDLMYQ